MKMEVQTGKMLFLTIQLRVLIQIPMDLAIARLEIIQMTALTSAAIQQLICKVVQTTMEMVFQIKVMSFQMTARKSLTLTPMVMAII